MMKPLFAAVLLLSGTSTVVAAPAQPNTATAAAGQRAGDSVPTTLRAMLADYRRYAETVWHADAAHPGEGYWGSGKGEGGNEGVRAISTTALAYAVLTREGEKALPTAERVGPALRYAAAIHTTGPETGTDGKHWGNSWQSAMWAANLGVAAWLTRDTLDRDTLAAVNRVVAFEADRFIDQAPPSMEPGDTKAEENSWDLTAPAAALLLMPDSPHAAGWRTAVLRYGFNTLSVEADRNSQTPADGSTVGHWVSTVQLFPDFTLENHDIFHPVYAMVGPATNAQAAVLSRLGGQPVPDALTFNVQKEWGMLQYIALPDGEWLYPQGLDWDLHDYEHLHYWTLLATLLHDPAAALLERRTVGYARRRQVLNGDGSFVGPSGSLGFAREAVQAERVAFALLMHEQFGAAPADREADYDRMTQRLAPARAFPWVGMVIHRTPRGLVSFSWKNHLMAQLVPQSKTHLNQPYVTTPNPETLVGGFTLRGLDAAAARQFRVTRHTVQTGPDGFQASVDAELAGGRLEQQIAMVSLGPGMVAYVDRVTARQPVTVTEERGLLVGIENDPVSGNKRVLQTDGGAQTLTGGQQKDAAIGGRWANVDGRLGLISALPSSLVYQAAGAPNRAGAREDFLVGAYRSGERAFAAGDVVTTRAGLLLPDASAAETAKLAAHTAATSTGGALTLTFVTPEGHPHTLTLAPEGTARWDGKVIQ